MGWHGFWIFGRNLWQVAGVFLAGLLYTSQIDWLRSSWFYLPGLIILRKVFLIKKLNTFHPPVKTSQPLNENVNENPEGGI